MQEQYRTVARAGVRETEINRSRFLCALAPAATEQEAQEFIARVRKEHPTASHHCYAYVIGADASVQKSGDDGEPGGTAGVPEGVYTTLHGFGEEAGAPLVEHPACAAGCGTSWRSSPATTGASSWVRAG